MHEVSPNSKETNILTLKSNSTNVVTNSDKTTQNHVPRRMKFVLNSPNGPILPKCVAQELLTIWETVTTKRNKMKPNQRVKEPNSTQSRLLILRQKWLGGVSRRQFFSDFNIRSILLKHAINLSEEDLNGHIIKLKTKTEDLLAIADSRSPMSFLNGKTAQQLQGNKKSVILKQIPPEDTARNLACYIVETIVAKGRLIVAIESGG